MTRAEALEHTGSIVDAVRVPVSADLEAGFATDPDGVHATVVEAIAVGLAGCSIEDYLPGADVLYAPGLTDIADVRTLVASVDRPVNVLARPGLPGVTALADTGAARISIGGSFSQVAYGALARAAHELLDVGTFHYLDLAAEGQHT